MAGLNKKQADEEEILDSFTAQKTLGERILRPGNGKLAAAKAIANAESALETLSVNFGKWMVEEVAKLAAARDTIVADPANANALDELFAASHDLKGQAETLGYPIVGNICASLCNLLEHCPKSLPVPPVLINQHVDSVKAIVREKATGTEHPTAAAIADKLHEVVNHFLAANVKCKK